MPRTIHDLPPLSDLQPHEQRWVLGIQAQDPGRSAADALDLMARLKRSGNLTVYESAGAWTLDIGGNAVFLAGIGPDPRLPRRHANE